MNLAGHRKKGGKAPSIRNIRTKIGYPKQCYLCGEPITENDKPEIDHIVPISLGGTNDIENLAWTHKRCNQIKANLSLEDLKIQMHKILNWLEQ